MPHLELTRMGEQRRVPISESMGEILRLTTGWLLAVLMLLPALIIKIADKLTMWRIQSRAQRERQS